MASWPISISSSAPEHGGLVAKLLPIAPPGNANATPGVK